MGVIESHLSNLYGSYLVFNNIDFGGGGNLFNVNWFQFFRYGDMNKNGIVDKNDLRDLVGYWLNTNCDLDLDGDCVITLYEFSAFARNWPDTSD